MTYFCSRCQQADPQLVNVRYDGSFITLLSIAVLGSAVMVRGHHFLGRMDPCAFYI